MPSTTNDRTNEIEALLDRAVELLIAPSLGNLAAVEELLREAVARMPDIAGESIQQRVRLCGRLIENAEARRPGSESALVYGQGGGVASRPSTARLQLEA
jgi:hypothetical protein